MADNPTCKTCKWWETEGSSCPGFFGACRIRAPIRCGSHEDGKGPPYPGWPPTSAQDWCGEYAPNVEAPNASAAWTPTLSGVLGAWPSLVAAAVKDRRLTAALRDAKPVAVRGFDLLLELPTKATYARGILRDRVGIASFMVASKETWGVELNPVVVDPVEPHDAR